MSLPLLALRLEDAPLLAQIHAASFPPEEVWSAQSFTDLLQDPLVSGWRLGEAAFILVRVVVGEGEVLSIATAPEARRQGLARVLLKGCLDKAETFFLEVAEDNYAAQTLYLDEGFVIMGYRRNYYPHNRTALTLRYSVK